MSVQVISKNGQPEWAVLPYEEYTRLIEQAEMLEDVRDFDALHEAVSAGSEELLSAAVAFALAANENPLKVWRDHRGLTRQRLADEAGISAPFLSQIETGKRHASITVLSRLAAILRVDVDDLVKRK